MEITINDLIPPYWKSAYWDTVGIDTEGKIVLIGANTINYIIIDWKKEVEEYTEAIKAIEDRLKAPAHLSNYHIQKILEWDKGVEKFGKKLKKYKKRSKTSGWHKRIKKELKNIKDKKIKAEQIIRIFSELKEKAEKLEGLEGTDKKPCLSVCRPFNYFSIGEEVKFFTGDQWISAIISEKCGYYDGQNHASIILKFFGSADTMEMSVKYPIIIKPDELNYLQGHSDFAKIWAKTIKIFDKNADTEKLFRSIINKEGSKL